MDWDDRASEVVTDIRTVSEQRVGATRAIVVRMC